MKSLFKFFAMAAIFGILLASCGTIMKTKNVNVVSESGTAAEVRIEHNGVNIYTGPLPARINVGDFPVLNRTNPADSFRVHYTDSDGNTAVYEIKKAFNWWVIFSGLSALFPLIVDAATSSFFTYNFSNAKVPIVYSDQPETAELWIVDGIPPQMMEYLTFVGSMNE